MAEVAESVMDEFDGGEDWSEWGVTVQDLSGRRVLMQPFVPQADGIFRATGYWRELTNAALSAARTE